jgi:hypothetical protein
MTPDPTKDPIRVGLPLRPFLYTVDQLAEILSHSPRTLHERFLYHEGRDVGIKHKGQMSCRDIAPPDERPDWRVAEVELVRWLRHKGFKYYNRGTITR